MPFLRHIGTPSVVPVAVVTDSTAYLPPGAAERHGVHVVPLEVRLGERTAQDGIDVTEAAGRVAAAEGQLRAAWTPLAHWFADQAEAHAAACLEAGLAVRNLKDGVRISVGPAEAMQRVLQVAGDFAADGGAVTDAGAPDKAEGAPK